MNYDVVTIGSATIDAFLTLSDSNSVHRDSIHHQISFTLGEKIPLSGSEFLLGGNASNVAVGVTRAGLKAALMAELAKDEFAEKIIKGLTEEGVHKELLVRGEGQSSFSIGINMDGERIILSEHQERHHNFHITSFKTKAIYLTSLGHTWRHVYTRTAHFVSQNPETLLAFNPGSVQFHDGVETFEYLLPLTSILFVNKEEAQRIVGKFPISDLLKKLRARGVRVISLTDGEAGAYAIDEKGEIYHQEKVKCPVVERTGAGDAYASAFLSGYLLGKPLKTCMLWGVHNAASVVGHVGSQPGLLHREELEKR